MSDEIGSGDILDSVVQDTSISPTDLWDDIFHEVSIKNIFHEVSKIKYPKYFS
jgi:hypothetical protein